MKTQTAVGEGYLTPHTRLRVVNERHEKKKKTDLRCSSSASTLPLPSIPPLEEDREENKHTTRNKESRSASNSVRNTPTNILRRVESASAIQTRVKVEHATRTPKRVNTISTRQSSRLQNLLNTTDTTNRYSEKRLRRRQDLRLDFTVRRPSNIRGILKVRYPTLESLRAIKDKTNQQFSNASYPVSLTRISEWLCQPKILITCFVDIMDVDP